MESERSKLIINVLRKRSPDLSVFLGSDLDSSIALSNL